MTWLYRHTGTMNSNEMTNAPEMPTPTVVDDAIRAEARRRLEVKGREDAIVAEMQRLRNRTEMEILRETVAELQVQIAELKTVIASSYRQ